jgi:uncharacterized protein YjbI with pentapeptide repeats
MSDPKEWKEKMELDEILRKHHMWLHFKLGGERAVFKGKCLNEVDLHNEDLREADFRNACLRAANLSRADLRDAYFDGANLYKANLHEANLRDTHMFQTNLERADLSNACLSGAYLYNANLRYADLSGCDFRGANLRRADLRDSDLRGADLRGADLYSSAWPLDVGTSDVEVDIRFVRLLLAHVACLRCDDPEFEIIKPKIMPYALKSHKASELLNGC